MIHHGQKWYQRKLLTLHVDLRTKNMVNHCVYRTNYITKVVIFLGASRFIYTQAILVLKNWPCLVKRTLNPQSWLSMCLNKICLVLLTIRTSWTFVLLTSQHAPVFGLILDSWRHIFVWTRYEVKLWFWTACQSRDILFIFVWTCLSVSSSFTLNADGKLRWEDQWYRKILRI